MLGVGDFRGPGNKTSLNPHHPLPHNASLLISAMFKFRIDFPVGSVELLGPEVLISRELRGWVGAGEDVQGSWRGKGQAMWS